MKILWLTNIPSPYRVDFFNELGKYCELTVLFEKSNSAERDRSWDYFDFINFNGIVMSGKSCSVDKAICIEVIKYLKKNIYDYIIVTNFASPTGLIAIEYMRLNNINYYIESDGGFPKSGIGFKERFKKHLIRGAKAYFSTAKSHDDYYLMYGAKRGRIYRYPFTSIHNGDILEKPVDESEKEKIKNLLEMKEQKIILSVGRFIYGKGYDVLLKSCKDLNNSCGVYIIGGEPTDEYIQMKKDLELNNVYFVGFKEKEELIKYYKAANLFVLPTRSDVWGLVINEAMANGLPVITTDKCGAGLELVSNYENGFIVPVDNVLSLTEKINMIINNDELCNKMSYKSLEVIKEYTIEKMVERHLKIFTMEK